MEYDQVVLKASVFVFVCEKAVAFEWNCTIQIEILYKLRVNGTSENGHFLCVVFFFLLSCRLLKT